MALAGSLPLWVIFVLTVSLAHLALEVGFRLGDHQRRASEKSQRSPVGEIVAAMLGLLALLLSFTFSLTAHHFEVRRSLVLDEANAVGTTWLRAGLLPDPQRTEIRNLLREYVQVRLGAFSPGQMQEAVAQSEEMHRRLWASAVTVGKGEPSSITTGLFINSLNEVIDLHAKRVTFGLRTRIPDVVWGLLYFVMVLGIGTLGYHAGVLGAGRSFSITILVLTLSAVLCLIADLDRPQQGLLKISQQALADTAKMMNDSQH